MECLLPARDLTAARAGPRRRRSAEERDELAPPYAGHFTPKSTMIFSLRRRRPQRLEPAGS
jgi:hypothetical protein